ncbi:3-phosphoshikimate 1-carboxyvinyltransferase [Bowmanella sp. Y26]|nr:3-phosphoshikimate 1-carboxyvinyltransferase [Bowmanella yangjiangensis]
MTQKSNTGGDVRQEPAMQNLLGRMPKTVADSFNDEQLNHLKLALGARSWGRHAVDVRTTLPVPFTRWRYYLVFLMGKNRRELSEREKALSALASAALLSAFIVFCVLLGLLVLYLIKSALGINLFDDFSLGIWSEFKKLFE